MALSNVKIKKILNIKIPSINQQMLEMKKDLTSLKKKRKLEKS